MDSEEFHIWLMVEQFKAGHPRYSDTQACDEIVKAGGIGFLDQKPGSSPAAPPDLKVRLIENADTLRRRFAQAVQIYKGDPNLASAWNRALDDVLGREHRQRDLPPSVARDLSKNSR